MSLAFIEISYLMEKEEERGRREEESGEQESRRAGEGRG